MMPESLRRYAGQIAFAGIAAALALTASLAAAAGWWCYGILAEQAAGYRSYQALQRNAGRADNLSAAYGLALREIEGIRKAMPPQNQGSHVLDALESGARGMNLGLSGVTALDEVPFPGYVELPFELTVTGEFPNLVRYLRALETQGMVLQVRRLSARNESLNKNHMQARLELSVFIPGAHRRARPSPDSAAAPAREPGAAP